MTTPRTWPSAPIARRRGRHGSKGRADQYRRVAASSTEREHRRARVAMIGAGVLHAMLAVNPVPWARAQMAFTLACHIILVPLGVSWALMVLIANYRGLKRDDAVALEPAQRWSKHGRDVRRRGRQWHRAHVRVRPPVAALHGQMGGCVRDPVRVRRRSSSPRRSSSRSTSSVAQAQALDALLDVPIVVAGSSVRRPSSPQMRG